MAWKQNIIEDFKQLVSFDSISFHERNTADWLLARLKSIGFSVEEDQAGAQRGKTSACGTFTFRSDR